MCSWDSGLLDGAVWLLLRLCTGLSLAPYARQGLEIWIRWSLDSGKGGVGIIASHGETEQNWFGIRGTNIPRRLWVTFSKNIKVRQPR